MQAETATVQETPAAPAGGRDESRAGQVRAGMVEAFARHGLDSDSWVSTSNDPRGFQKGHSIVNAGLTLRSPDRWSTLTLPSASRRRRACRS